MRIAIMQPYAFPYLGYFQLVAAVDEFVLLDDVNFIKRGWVNRNRILVQGQPHTFSIPIKDVSQNVHIGRSMIAPDETWRKKLLNTIKHNYSKAPRFHAVFPFVEHVINGANGSIADLSEEVIRWVMEYVGREVLFSRSSEAGLGEGLRGSERIVAIAKGKGASIYINSIGGWELYEAVPFAAQDMELRFLKMKEVAYEQWPGSTFVPALSIIDVLMFCAPEQIGKMLDEYELIEKKD